MKIRHQKPNEKIILDMTPMIDVVFQLLAFFVMTFKIVAPEGDFNIKMPLAAPSDGTPEENLHPPIKISLRAGVGGVLSGILLGERNIGGDFKQLRTEVFGLVGAGGGAPSTAGDFEVEFTCDYDLQYQYVIAAITHVTGYRDPNTDKVVKLIEKVKFTPPQKNT